MRKLIFGIFAVVCVQFAFVIYTALQSPVEVAVGPIYMEPPAEYVADDLQESADPQVAVEEDTKDPSVEPSREIELPQRRPSERSTSSARTAGPVDPTPRIEANPGRVAEQFTAERPYTTGDFETVVISYNRDPEVSNCDKDKFEPPQPKKRSYIAKAAPVVKKPWEWIKSIGSKLN